MYKKVKIKESKLQVNESSEGESLELKLNRMLNNKEPLKDQGTALIYTERSAGVMAGYNIKTDRWEVALDGIDKIQKSETARRESKANMEVVKDDNNGETESTQGTN